MLKLVARICFEVWLPARYCGPTFGNDYQSQKGENAAIQRPSPFPPTLGLSLFAPVIASLFAVGMLVTPLPVVSLVSGSLLVVRAIGPVSFHHIRPVRPIFMIVPIMIVAMARIIDPYLYAFLGLRCGHDCRRENSSS
jgi:hypothetical protein